jgi:transposase
MTSPGSLSPDAAGTLGRILSASPELTAARSLIRAFADMVTGLQGQHLDAWITAARAASLPAFHSFANGLERDYDAVRNGLTLPYSSGAVEGTNCKIKHLKRLMYGRANFDLLRKMAILH